MRLRVLYFAAVRELVGLDVEELDVPDGVQDVRALGAWLEERHEPLRGRLGAVRFAVDEELAAPERALHDGMVVALIPPVAGG